MDALRTRKEERNGNTIAQNRDVDEVLAKYVRALEALYKRTYQRFLSAKEGPERIVDPDEQQMMESQVENEESKLTGKFVKPNKPKDRAVPPGQRHLGNWRRKLARASTLLGVAHVEEVVGKSSRLLTAQHKID